MASSEAPDPQAPDAFLEEARQLAEARDILAGRADACDTMHLLDETGHHDRSAAVLRVAADLPFPWSLLRFLRFVPRSLRDACYDFVARRRRRWSAAQSTTASVSPRAR